MVQIALATDSKHFQPKDARGFKRFTETGTHTCAHPRDRCVRLLLRR